MSDLVIETTGLHKEFRTRRGRRVIAVDDLDLAVPAGGVHGFLGPNGSGKTTTIRMLLGLARASSGEMRLFGQPVPRRAARGHRPGRRRRRAAQVHPRPSPAGTTSAARPLDRRAPDTRVDAALEQVGLTGRDRERYRGYSLGHEAAPGDRRDAAQGARPADPRRADQRAGPGRHPRHPRRRSATWATAA